MFLMCRGAASIGGMPVIKLGVRRTRRFRRGMVRLPANREDDDDDWCPMPATVSSKSAGIDVYAGPR